MDNKRVLTFVEGSQMNDTPSSTLLPSYKPIPVVENNDASGRLKSKVWGGILT